MNSRGTTQSFVIQPLERRTLLAGVPHPTVPIPAHSSDPTIQADLDQLHSDLKKASDDAKAAHDQITADSKSLNAELDKLRASDANLDNELAPLKQQVKTDTKALHAAVKPDLQAIADLRDNFADTFWADRKALRDAKEAKDSDAAQAARDKLKSDGEDYSNQLHDLHTKMVADAQPFKDKIKADKEAIWDKMIELDPALGPLVDKLRTDQTSFASTLKSDSDAIKADLDKLKADREAAGSNTATT
jgi:chromosome segregation ATPase